MTFRWKLLLACLPLALAPLAFFGWRARGEITTRLGARYEERVTALADVIAADLRRESASIRARLDQLARAMAADNRLRRALLGRAGSDRAYLLDYAGRAMELAGLDMLRIQDGRGRVLSSGHFRNEYGVLDPALPAALRRAGQGGSLVRVPTASGSMLALARARTVQVGARAFTLVGGTAVNDRFLDGLARGTGLDVALHAPIAGNLESSSGPAGRRPLRFAGTPPDPRRQSVDSRRSDAGASSRLAREVVLPYVGPGPDTIARFVVRASTAPLEAIRGSMDRWLMAALGAAVVFALLLVVVVAGRLSHPLSELAGKAVRVDLERPGVTFSTGRRDEIGALSRVLDAMTHRLRASAARLREAERRATIGEVARQVNHDIRNGLVPIRNVIGHLAGLARERPAELPSAFLERRGTLDSGVDYLHSLAANYARLSPEPDPRACDLNAIVRETVNDLETDLAPGLPPVHADPVALRRILENLIVNARESLDGSGGRVVVSTRLDRGGGRPGSSRKEFVNVRPRGVLTVADDGRGMSADARARMFEGFYSTKPDGTGLGLSIVRRLVHDFGGRIRVGSEPDKGTRVTVEIPCAVPDTRAEHPEQTP